MSKLLYLVHRIPYPPNKGDKVRSYHLLRHLAERHQVYLGTFIDDPDDERHLDTVRQWCAEVHAVRLDPLRARIASLAGIAHGDSLTLHYYRSASLRHWVDRTVLRESIDTTVVFSSSMAQYAMGRPDMRVLVDFVDVDSDKWTQYSQQHRWPMSWLYAREGRTLLAFERQVAASAQRSYFVTEQECALFRSLAPECSGRVESMSNGVDADYFSPDVDRSSPFSPGEKAIVFTGAMDYWPNVDAVRWFVSDMLPQVRTAWPLASFHIVGRSPTQAVLELAGEHVKVTGTVPDVRPYLQHADVVVAPLRLARGLQNKILEAMAMARPVVAARQCVDAIGTGRHLDLVPAQSPEEYCAAVIRFLGSAEEAKRVGSAGRRRVLDDYSWPAHLTLLDGQLANVPGGGKVIDRSLPVTEPQVMN